MKVKRAEHMKIFLCDQCAAVHIGLFRNGRMIAEAIPNNPEDVIAELHRVIGESRDRQALPTGQVH